MRRLMLALVGTLILYTGPAHAVGGLKGQWELGAYVGQAWPDDYGFLQPDNGFLYGGRLGYFLSDSWSLEGSAQRYSSDKDTIPSENVDFESFRLNLLYNFAPGSRIRPFLTAGGGYERVDAQSLGDEGNIGWNAGGGLRIFPSRNFNIRLDGRYVQVGLDEFADENQGNVEASLGLSLLFGGGGEPEAPNQPPSVSCASERAEILPGESVRLTATATDPEGDPLTYEWTSTAGVITGSGATATLDFTGVTAPATATATVRVSDGKGNTGTSDCSVRLMEPARAPEAVSCLAGGFPRNLSRLTNVDKACLDDVVQRLKADPRARVTVIGYADTRETNPSEVGDQRAAAVRSYLVSAGIEEARITTRSAGDTNPVDTGTDATAQARNRRVVVWFVPEGATVPE